jgi:DNA-binding NarL/FixJ family response regulator
VRSLAPRGASGDSPTVTRHAQGSTRDRRRRAGVLAVDDQVAFLSVMRDLVEATENLEVVAEAASAEQAIELLREFGPGMVLMDIWMPGRDGMAAVREIKALLPETVVVLTSTTPPDELPLRVQDVGADAVIWKSDLEPALLDALWLRGEESSPSDS